MQIYSCPILADLRRNQHDLGRAMRSLRRNLKHCERCESPCQGYLEIQCQIQAALDETIKELGIDRQ